MGLEWKSMSKSADEKLFEDSELVPLESQSIEDSELVALESETVEDTGTATPISRMILLKVCEYLKYHLEAHKPNSALTDDEIKTWDQEFINVDRDTLFDLLEVLFLKPSSNWEFDCYFFVLVLDLIRVSLIGTISQNLSKLGIQWLGISRKPHLIMA